MIKNFVANVLLWMLDLPLKIRKRVKKLLITNRFLNVGTNFVFDPIDSIFPSDGKTQIGDNVFIGPRAYMGGEIHIGNRVMFGPNVSLLAGNHIFAIRGKSPRFIRPLPGQNSEPIVIQDEVWIGADVVILGNVIIGIGSVVGAGSVVTCNICPFTVSVGSPCRPVRKIFSDDNLRIHLKEIGYRAQFVEEVVAMRIKFLAGLVIPVIDNTDIYKQIIYEVP